jgi:hypothetical protein
MGHFLLTQGVWARPRVLQSPPFEEMEDERFDLRPQKPLKTPT